MRAFLPAALVVLLWLLGSVSGWAQSESGQTTHADDTGSSETTRELTVSPSKLNFGKVAIGKTARLQIDLTAEYRAVTISSDKCDCSEFSVTGITLPITIRPGETVRATIRFRPRTSGTASAKTRFISNAKDSPTIVESTGTGLDQTAHHVDLTWDEVSGVAGYNIYRSTVHNGPYEQINRVLDASTSYTDRTVVDGETYYYVTTAVNSEGEQSGYSDEVKAEIPNN